MPMLHSGQKGAFLSEVLIRFWFLGFFLIM